MKIIKYIFFSLFLLTLNVYANNSYIVLNNQNISEIEELLNKNNKITINLNYNEKLVAKRKVLDLIKGKDKIITYNILNNNEVIYSYIFNGNYFNDSYNDIDLKITNTSLNDKIINEIFNKKIIINTNYKGYYPKGTILSIKNIININKVNLYNINNNKINILKNTILKKDNFINFDITKGDTYIITNKTLVNIGTIKVYLTVLIVLFIEIIVFLLIVCFKNREIDFPKLKR